MTENQIQTEMTLSTISSGIKEVETPEGKEKVEDFEDKLFIVESTTFSKFEELKD
jgi:hypothetical protein